MKGERGPNLFPKPVYVEPPFQQRETIYKNRKIEFHKNLTLLAQAVESGHKNQHKLMEKMDLPRFKALCRGEDLRVTHILTIKSLFSAINNECMSNYFIKIK